MTVLGAQMVIARYAANLPSGYVKAVRNGGLARLRDLDQLLDDPHRPAVALPTDREESFGPTKLPVYEIYALGGRGS